MKKENKSNVSKQNSWTKSFCKGVICQSDTAVWFEVLCLTMSSSLRIPGCRKRTDVFSVPRTVRILTCYKLQTLSNAYLVHSGELLSSHAVLASQIFTFQNIAPKIIYKHSHLLLKKIAGVGEDKTLHWCQFIHLKNYFLHLMDSLSLPIHCIYFFLAVVRHPTVVSRIAVAHVNLTEHWRSAPFKALLVKTSLTKNEIVKL